jgi:hypothetical protein
MGIECVCGYCGESFTSAPSRVANGRGKYCSRACGNAVLNTRKRERSLNERFWSRIERLPSGCWKWTGGCDGKGYGKITLSGGRRHKTHRLAYELLRGPIPPGAFLLHSCDYPPCCNPDHLRPGDVSENAADMTSRHRQARGAEHGSARLNEEDVRDIRVRLARGQFQQSIADCYGVHIMTVSDIKRRKTWEWLT